MQCSICGTTLAARQKKFCSKQCSTKAWTYQRRESGRLLKANMDPDAYARKLDRAKQSASRLKPRQCVTCGEVKLIRASHASSRPICKPCSPVWSGINPSPSKALAKRHLPRVHIPTVTHGRGFIQSTCQVCGSQALLEQAFKFCSPRCKRKGTGRLKFGKGLKRRIYSRDNGICQLCFEPVDMGHNYLSDSYNPKAPTLDHIVPVSLGGSNHHSNLRLTHHMCNSLRQAGL